MKQSISINIWTITLTATVVLGLWFLWPQLATLVLTALMAYLFYPMYLRLHRRGKNGRIAATTTLVASFLVVLIPLAIIVIAAVSQLMSLAEIAGRAGTWERLPDFTYETIRTVDSTLKSLTGNHVGISEQNILDFLRNTLPGIARSSVGLLLGFVATLPGLSIALLIYTFVFIELLVRGPELIKKIRQLSPYSEKDTDYYIERIGLMANAMVKGQLMIAMIISAISAALLIPLGYGQYFFIFFILFTILNFIPLGCGLVVMPLALYSMVTGQFWMGLVVIILYNIAGWLDPILRPKFIPKKIQLSSALTIVATFCGIAYFGILGVVYGPILMILLLTAIGLYLDNKKDTGSRKAKA
ncbi:MAG: AI-2E family transporter [Candidatus Saccharimonadales bacterium]